MIRIVFFLVLFVAAAWGVVWVAQNPGEVSLNWNGWQVDTSAGVLAGAAVALALVAALGYRAWVLILGTPAWVRTARRERRSRLGYKALTKGMVAVAAGDGEESSRQVAKADGLLGEPPLTLLLKAQSAQLNGDERAAETFFKTMLDEPEMEFLGLRGLMNQAMKRGDDATAIRLAHRAQMVKPKSPWLAETLFDLEGRTGDWLAADDALSQLTKLSDLTQGETKHRKAVVALGKSHQAERDGDPSKAMKFAEQAFGLDTALTAAAMRLTQLHLGRGHTKKARDVIEKAWALQPHPDFVQAYYRANSVTDELAKVISAEKLLALKPDDIEGHLTVAEAALDAELWGQARTHLGTAMELGCDTRRVYSLMAQLEEREHDNIDQAHHWWMRASAAKADPAWVCGECGQVHAMWAAHCPSCTSFDSLYWGTPPGVGAVAVPKSGRRVLLTHESQPEDVT